jgi:S1-C subfamily serine protease
MESSSPQSALLALSNDIASTVDRVGAAVYAVEARRRVGSTGFLVRPNLLVTADHAIDEDDEIEVVGADGATVEATLVGRDPSTDIAVLRLEHDAASHLALDTPGALRVGGIALAIARDDDGDLAAAMGIVGTVGAPWDTWSGGSLERFVRPALDLTPRFSGSPLVDATGALLGMNTWGLSRRRALTVPTDALARIVEAVLRGGGRIARGWIGVALQRVDLSPSVAHAAGLASHAGLIVLDVAEGSPADAAALCVGDVLVAAGDVRLRDVDDLQRVLAPGSVGTTVAFTIIRGSAATEVSVEIAEAPHAEKHEHEHGHDHGHRHEHEEHAEHEHGPQHGRKHGRHGHGPGSGGPPGPGGPGPAFNPRGRRGR